MTFKRSHLNWLKKKPTMFFCFVFFNLFFPQIKMTAWMNTGQYTDSHFSWKPKTGSVLNHNL